MTVFHHKYKAQDIKLRTACLRSRKCPDFVSRTEPPMAEELREIMSGNIFITDSGEGYTFINKLTSYPMDSCMSCETYIGGNFHLIPLQVLKENTDWLRIHDQYLYPMLVWAIKKYEPILAYVSPGAKKPVKVIRKFSSDCMAYMICTALREE